MNKFILIIFLFLNINYSFAEVVTCSKDYSDTDTHPAYRLKDLQIKFEKYFPGTSFGALQAKGQIGYAGVRAEVKRYYSKNKFVYSSVINKNDFNLTLKKSSEDIYSGTLILNKGSAFENTIKQLKCSITGILPEPYLCAETQGKKDISLFDALRSSDLDQINYSLECGAEINSTDSLGCSPLLKLLDPNCGFKNLSISSPTSFNLNQMASLLIDSGANLESVDPTNHQSAIHKAVKINNTDVVNILAELEANINVQDINGSTPLILAVLNRNYFLVQELLDLNADTQLKNNKGLSAFDIAKVHQLDDIAELLLPIKKIINIQGNLDNIGCSVSNIELTINESVEISLKASPSRMFRLLSPELGLDLMAQPNEKIKTRFTPNRTGTYFYICGPHNGPEEQQMKGTIIIK
ncbi:hypothetical protein C0V70_05945 [Bacteriovorax stolpii]|uniref:Uncharacterized protein n=1 Tax=Bacteriovorax stolpii TaxID=960 RepID=A0A2K9NQ78_BACTC|nr:ankyrin repeat domain-containing protein [Bacteriovorax stolpii]AUN97663.1 hypothetical protein C0V70_05945 [Bacteriovorax stolpii]TDP52845.1 ankyrin repeat protein [Bacteriovorax stolpii]